MSSDFLPTCWLCARQDRNGTARSCMDSLQLYGSSSWKTVKIRKVNLSLLPNGPVYAVIFVNDSTNMNQKDGHRAMTGSVFVHLMRNRDDLCVVVKWCAQKEHNHSLLVQWFSSVAQIIFSAFSVCHLQASHAQRCHSSAVPEAEQLFNDLEYIMLVSEASNLGVSEHRFEPLMTYMPSSTRVLPEG